MTPPSPLPALEARLAELDHERALLLDQLREEKRKQLLHAPQLNLDERDYPTTPAAKVALFLNLFGARRDVYPRLWQNLQTGKKGYGPVCETIWKNGVRLKPMEILAHYGAAKFSPMDSKAVEAHLRGKETIGTYAIRPDDTCIFLAADFDGTGWQQEVCAYRDEASALGISCLVEISRSGNGAHAWIFFAEPVEASLARNLGSLIMAQVTAKLPSNRTNAYDRFFPNQDTLPQGGFGNLIALPLQKERRNTPNSGSREATKARSREYGAFMSNRPIHFTKHTVARETLNTTIQHC